MTRSKAICTWLVCFNIRNCTWFPAPCMVNQQFGVDAELLVQKISVVIIGRFTKRASCNISHRKKAVFLQPFGITFANAPKIC